MSKGFAAGVAVVGVALAARLLFIWQTRDTAGIASLAPGLDADLTWRAADHLIAGRAWSFELGALSAPLFAYLVAGWKLVFGDHLAWFRVFMAVQGALRFGLLYRLCRHRSVSVGASAAACAVVALLPSTIYFDTMPIKVGIELTLLVLALTVVTRRSGSTWAGLLGQGAMVGGILACLLASQLNTFLYVVPVLGFAIADRQLAPARRLAAAGAALIVLLPVAASLGSRGDEPGERFVSRAGVDLVIGSHDGADGIYSALPGITGNPFGHAFLSRVAIEAERGRPITAVEADREYRNRAVRYVLDHPVDALAVGGRKLALFFNDEEVANETSVKELRQRAWAVRSPAGFGVLVVFAVAGSAGLIARRRRRDLMLLAGLVGAQLAANLITFVGWRFRLPAVIPLGLLSAHGLDHLVQLARERHTHIRPLVVTAALCAAVTGFVSLPLLRARRSDLDRIGRASEIGTRQADAIRARVRTTAEPVERGLLLHAVHRYTEAFEAFDRDPAAVSQQDAAAAAYLEYLVARGDYAGAGKFMTRLDDRAERVLGGVSPPVAAALATIVGSSPRFERRALRATYRGPAGFP